MNTDTPVELVTAMDEDSMIDSEEDSMIDSGSSEDYYSQVVKMDFEPYKSQTATPLLELSSISIRCDTFREFPHAQLVCHVTLTDDYFRTFTLFHQDCNNDALCPRDEFLEIKLGTSEYFCPLLIPNQFILGLVLKDRSRETVIMKETLLWDFSSELVYDKPQWKHFDTAGNGYVRVCHTIFRYALSAVVKTKVIKKEQEDDLDATVSGTVIATTKVWNGSVRHVLFDKLQSDKIMLPSTGLCLRSCFSVPAYSSLKIQAKLEINNEIIGSGEDDFVLEAFDKPCYSYKKKIKGEKGHVVVEVEMSHARWWFPEQFEAYDKKPMKHVRRIFECGEVSAERENISKSEDIPENEEIQHGPQEKRLPIHCFERPILERNETSIVKSGTVDAESANISKREDIPENEEIQFGHQDKRIRIRRVIPMSEASPEIRIARYPLPRYIVLPLVELFSISACRYVNTDDDHSAMLLNGTIEIEDEFEIFEVVGKKSALLLPCQKIPLVGSSRCYVGRRFVVTLNLKDNEGREISRGIMRWDFYNVERWFDTRLSSVVQGKNGFAAIHYVMFSGAVQAKVKVSIRYNDGWTSEVNGKIWAWYLFRNYSTPYDEYFQSLLFQEETDFLQLHDGADIPLLKSVVAVPVRDVLVVELKLYRQVAGQEESLKGKAFFDPRSRKEQTQIIQGTSYEVAVSVQWGR